LFNPDDAKTFLADLLAGATVNIEGNAAWLRQSQLPIAEDGTLTIQVTEQSLSPRPSCLIYHPATILIELSPLISHKAETAIATLQTTLSTLNLSPMSIAAILTSDPTHSGIRAIAETLDVPIRWGQTQNLANIVYHDQQSRIAIAADPIDPSAIGQTPGKLSIIGTGPGSAEWMSPQVKEVLRSSTDWIGYQTYLNLVEPLRTNQRLHIFDNREELERAALALNLAAEGRSVVMVSSGDPGIYAMAAAVFEVLERDAKPDWDTIEIQVCPGISAMQAAAAQVGAPLGHDFCAISLSDILKPWETIVDRLSAAAQADFAIAFYNPISKTRTWQLEKAKALLLNYRSPETPIVLARNLGRPGQQTTIKTLGTLSIDDADMRTVILIGSSKTRTFDRAGRTWVYTPRHYKS
jgi:cobalt-precorrin 5A hydrolase/precorrin-3B C17-methyltransferase